MHSTNFFGKTEGVGNETESGLSNNIVTVNCYHALTLAIIYKVTQPFRKCHDMWVLFTKMAAAKYHRLNINESFINPAKFQEYGPKRWKMSEI